MQNVVFIKMNMKNHPGWRGGDHVLASGSWSDLPGNDSFGHKLRRQSFAFLSMIYIML
jgi:hypothetical protein